MNRRISLCIVLVLPVLLLSPGVDAQSMTERENTVCQLRQERYQEVVQTFSDKQAAINERMTGVASSAEVRRQEIDEVISGTRQDFAGKYEEWFTGYMERAQDEPHRAAATIFYEELKQLIAVRHESLDQARTVFRAQIDQIRQQRFANIQTDISDFQTKTDDAFRGLGNTCSDSRRNNGEARKSFVRSLQESRLRYAELRRSKQSYKDQMQAAVQAREQVFTDAKKVFEQGLQEALSNLRNVDPDF